MTDVDVTDWATIHRVLLPVPSAMEGVRPLYVNTSGDSRIVDRTSLGLEKGARASFSTYFGGLPTAVWMARTDVRRVRLSLFVEGAARISVRAADASGVTREICSEDVAGEASLYIELDERTNGWLWFEAYTPDEPATLRDMRWSAPTTRQTPASVTVAITTFNRVADCLGVVRDLAADDQVAARVEAIIVVDQGTERISDADEFGELAETWGSRLHVREQANLGGSGGFSRGMLEAAESRASHVLLLDDDVVLEPESLLRMLALADHAEGEPLVGAHMLSLTAPTVLHTYGERVDRSSFWWVPVAPELSAVDLSALSLERTPAFSRSYDVDFNGWWMCLVPLAVVREVGAAMPFFIKWDDAEYGLRAREAGHRTVTLPGAALWHVPWTAKDDGLDWQAYFQLRNRVVTALLHSPRGRGKRLLLDTLAQDLNHVLCAQYGSAAVRHLALRDVLTGPEHLHRTLDRRRTDASDVLARFGQDIRPESMLPAARSSRMPVRPRGIPRVVRRFGSVLLRQLRPSPSDTASVDVRLERKAGKWWALGSIDSAVVESATGSGGFVLRRDRSTAAALTRSSFGLRLRLWWRWPRLAHAYRTAAPGLSGSSAWGTAFGASAR